MAPAIDLSVVKLLAGFGIAMRLSTFKALAVAVTVCAVPSVFLVSTVAVSLPAALVTKEGMGRPAHAAFAAGCAVLLAVALVYSSVLDLLRQHFTVARYTVSRSPLRGLWLAADISLLQAVVAERGVLLAWRAGMQAVALAGAGVYLARAGSARAADVVWIAVLLPSAYLCGGLALALAHAGSSRRPARAASWAGAVLGLGIASATGALAAVLADDATGLDDTAVAPVTPALVSVGTWSGPMRLLLLVALVAALAALTIGWARGGTFAQSDDPVGPTISRARGTALLHAVQGWSGLAVGLRVTLVVAWLSAALLGWRLCGGAAVSAEHGVALDRTLVLIAAAAGMVIASNGLYVLGQTRLLWHYRVLFEAGLPPRRLWLESCRPALLLGAAVGCAIVVTAVALGRPRAAITAVLVLLCGLLVEMVVDSYFATADAHDGARQANTALAVVAYLAAAPALFIGWSGAPWTWPALAALVVVYYTGGTRWFAHRLERLPRLVST